jgi:hypothetical protein
MPFRYAVVGFEASGMGEDQVLSPADPIATTAFFAPMGSSSKSLRCRGGDSALPVRWASSPVTDLDPSLPKVIVEAPNAGAVRRGRRCFRSTRVSLRADRPSRAWAVAEQVHHVAQGAGRWRCLTGSESPGPRPSVPRQQQGHRSTTTTTDASAPICWPEPDDRVEDSGRRCRIRPVLRTSTPLGSGE